jgi:hypothetical protein
MSTSKQLRKVKKRCNGINENKTNQKTKTNTENTICDAEMKMN